MPTLPLLVTRTTSYALLSLAFVTCSSSCARRARNQLLSASAQANDQQSPSAFLAEPRPQPININTASAKELEGLPGIGKGLAERIIEHREKHGPFRRAEHLIIVRGISDRRFRALRDLITVE
jgi:competence ComEA-like helix-hairpin-helix protein